MNRHTPDAFDRLSAATVRVDYLGQMLRDESAAIRAAAQAMQAGAERLQAKFARQDAERGHAKPLPVLFTAKVDTGVRLGELRARFEERD